MAENSFSGNPNLKKIGINISFTEEQILEYQKCSKDPVYFIDNYCYIITLDHGIQPFKLYDCQKEKIKVIHENRKVILMEGRQQGKTQSSVAYILWYTLFQEAKNVAILANKETAAREAMSRYQMMYENLPIWMQQGVKVWNKGDIELENGSKVFTSATTASGIRGKSVNMLYIDEAAIIPNNIAEAFFTSVYPVISAGVTTKILITSTPLGYNHFWKFWNDAENKRNDFIPLQIPYWRIPGRDEKWADEQKRLLGELKYNQEVLCTFLGSALTLIRGDIIGQLSYDDPILSDNGLDLYQYPIQGERNAEGLITSKPHVYVIVADTAKGVGGDYSAFVIMDVTTVPYRMVGKYRNNTIAPMLYPSVIHKLAKQYNNAYILTEVNSSEQVAHILYNDYEYENILFVHRDTKGQRITGGFAGAGKTQLGVNTDKRVKRIGCFNFKSLVEEKKLLIPDADVISEISTFIEKRNSYEADEGYHDDLVMGLVLFSWLVTNPYFKEITDVNLREAIYQNKIKQIEEEMLPLGFINDGQHDEVYLESGDLWGRKDDNESSRLPAGYMSSNLWKY
jgi:hypothetical protein